MEKYLDCYFPNKSLENVRKTTLTTLVTYSLEKSRAQVTERVWKIMNLADAAFL